MAAAPDIKHGKEFEKRVSPFFENLYKEYPCRWERVLDSGAAGNFVRKAESDFKFIRRSRETGAPYTFLVECKASLDSTRPFHSNFRRFVSSGQNSAMAGMRRGGGTALILFRNMYQDILEIWPGRLINEAYPIKRITMDIAKRWTLPDTDTSLASLAQSLVFEAEEWAKALEGEKYEIRLFN